MPNEDLMQPIATAQHSPPEDYVLWAVVGDGAGEIALQTVRLPLGLSAEESLRHVRNKARESLAAAGFIGAEADAVRLHLNRLPTREEITAILEAMVSAGQEMAFFDFTHWEAARRQLHLEPKPDELGREPELDYRGLKIRRSAVS